MGDEATGQGDGSAMEVDGIDAAGVGAWFAEQVPAARAPLSYERIAGGHSNLTYRVTDAAGNEWALRRPPLGKTLSSAHDMVRALTTAQRRSRLPLHRSLTCMRRPAHS